MKLRTAADEVREMASRSSSAVSRAALDIARARITGDADDYGHAVENARGLFGRVLSLSDLMGRRRMNLRYERAADGVSDAERETMASAHIASLGAPTTPALPKTEFREAVEDILTREPVLASGYEQVAALYATRHAAACARALDVATTQRVSALVSEYVRGARPIVPSHMLTELEGWSDAYAETVFATQVATAYSAGMWSRMADPDVARVIPGAKLVSQLLPTTRANHAACHGLVAATEAQVWDRYSPPLGYRCGCALREVTLGEAKRMGWLDSSGRMLTITPPTWGANAHPDPGFGRGRPDRRIAFGEVV